MKNHMVKEIVVGRLISVGEISLLPIFDLTATGLIHTPKVNSPSQVKAPPQVKAPSQAQLQYFNVVYTLQGVLTFKEGALGWITINSASL